MILLATVIGEGAIVLGFHTSSAPARLMSASENSLCLEELPDALLVDELDVSLLMVKPDVSSLDERLRELASS